MIQRGPNDIRKIIVIILAIFLVLSIVKFMVDKEQNKQNEVKQKYHAFIAPFVPVDFSLDNSTFDYQLIDAGTRLTETYQVNKTKAQAFEEVILLFRKHGLSVSDEFLNDSNPYIAIGKNNISVYVKDKNATSNVTLITFEVSNLIDEVLPTVVPTTDCVGNCDNQMNPPN